ncbi:MAG: hypothetical protein ACRDSK_09185 [Actinophytocola sp.]|jgi:hypothetical protein|uniref:hypothetical protein n=1 Tax=Actinophytocola sp. TaxID=1872138 RepID=UPI003D6BB67D
MHSELPRVRLELCRADAVVLFDWLMSTDLDAVPIAHPAQKQAFIDLADELESQTDVLAATIEEVALAQQEVAKNMGR